MNDLRYDDRKSNSSHTGSLCEDADRELFDAEIVTPSAAFEQFNTESRPSIVQIDQSVAKRRRSHIPDRPQVSLNLWSIMRNCIGKELSKIPMPFNTESRPSIVQIDQSVAKRRRSHIPDRPQVSLNLWSIMRNCIGKELSKIPMPVNFNEPLSVLQRISEDLEYSHLLDTAAECSDPLEQMCYIAAYAVSSYSTTGNRTTKPFNPLLGETFECDRSSDLGWKSLAEQVSHHPPITAHHADGHKWTVHQDFTMTSRFRGKYLSVIPIGYSHVKFLHQKNEYSFKKVTTTVHNIIVGKLWIDNHGEMVIDNHTTGDKCFLKFHPYSYFSREIPRKVTGLVKDSKGKVQWIIQGTWDRSLDMLKVIKDSDNKGEKSIFETGPPRRIPGCDKMYYFTRLAIELNEMEEGVAPTDSRLRPDQRLMEEGKWDDANRLKVQIEEKQRAVRRRREALAEKALQSGEPFEEYQPLWFKKTQHEQTGAVIHMFTGEYWEKKRLQDWSMCPNIF
uniref:Oxysterol-binding protein n=1 Tax=Ascaris lumbricoides TaxID=6252 RepID=A0A0M3IM38_ASCLU